MTATTTVSDEVAIAIEISRIGAEIEVQKAQLSAERSALRRAGEVVQLRDRRAALERRSEADQRVAELTTSLEAKRRHLEALTARAEAGDETLRGIDIAAAKEDVGLAEQRVANAVREAKAVVRETAAALADNHLAHLAADIIETATLVPVVVRTDASSAPALDQMVVLSQTVATGGYGTMDVSGDVAVTLVGEPDLDWTAIRRAFEDAGCVGEFSASGLHFDEAYWPLIPLAAPSSLGVTAIVSEIFRRWKSEIETNATALTLLHAGYPVQQHSLGTGLTSLTQRGTERLAADNGRAIGAATLTLGIGRSGGGSAYGAEDLIATAAEIVKEVRAEHLGNLSPAGEIVGLKVTRAEKADGSIWGQPATYGITGNAMYPVTIEMDVEVEFAYESIVVVAGD